MLTTRFEYFEVPSPIPDALRLVQGAMLSWPSSLMSTLPVENVASAVLLSVQAASVSTVPMPSTVPSASTERTIVDVFM